MTAWAALISAGLPAVQSIHAACRRRGLPREVHDLALDLRAQVEESLGLLGSIVGDVPISHPGPQPDHRSREITDLRHRTTIAEARADALAHDLARTQERVARLEAALAEADDNTEETQVYAMLGLRPGAHDVVLKAARRSLLALYYPEVVSR